MNHIYKDTQISACTTLSWIGNILIEMLYIYIYIYIYSPSWIGNILIVIVCRHGHGEYRHSHAVRPRGSYMNTHTSLIVTISNNTNTKSH